MDFDFQTFLYRKKLKQREIAEILGLSLGYIGMLASGKSRPSYEVMVKLIENGISLNELFGDRLAEMLLDNTSIAERKPSKEQFLEGVREALADIAKGSNNP